MVVYVVLGIPGAGKSYVLSKAIENMKGKFKVLTFGTLLFDIAMEEGLVDDRDKLRYLPKDKTDELRIKVAQRIVSEEGNVILDTHASMKTSKGYAPGLPAEVLNIIKPHSIIIVEGKPEDIAERRTKDQANGTRDRSDFGGKEMVEEWQMINRAFAASYCATVGSNLAIVLNEQGKADEAAQKMKEVFE